MTIVCRLDRVWSESNGEYDYGKQIFSLIVLLIFTQRCGEERRTNE
jgi:hypothetical protein